MKYWLGYATLGVGMQVPHTHAAWVRHSYFWIGILATLAYRVIIVLTEVGGVWLKLSWYVGTIGFVLYFAHRYQVAAHRAQLIAERQLKRKVAALSGLDADDQAAMGYVFSSLESSTEKWIYVTIFVSSALSLAAGVYLDFIR